MKTEKEIIDWKRRYARPSFIGNTQKQNEKIRHHLVRAIDVLHSITGLGSYGSYSEQNEQILDILEEILYPKSRHEFDDDGETRDPDNIGIDIVVYDSYGRDLD